MRALLPLLLACHAEIEPIPDPEVRFDTEIANVAHVRSAGPQVAWGLDPDALDHDGWEVEDGFVLVGLPQGSRAFVQTQAPEQASNVVAFDVPTTGLSDLQVLRSSPDSAMAQGYVAAAILDEQRSGIAIYDGQGRLVWGWLAPDPQVSGSPVFADNGADVLAIFSDRDRDVDSSTIRRIPLNGSPLTETDATLGHHTFVERDGAITWLSRNFPEVADPFDPTARWTLQNDAIRSGPEGSASGGEVVFDLLDLGPFFWPCTHVDQALSRYGVSDVHDWSHANSLVWLPDSGTWVYGVRLHDAIWGLDANFQPLWKLGGTDPTIVADTDWSHPHFTDAWDGGILLFDNGAHRDPPHSRVIELAIDLEAGTATTVWTFEQPADGFNSWLGDARRLPNGNRLLAFTELGRILEVTPGGEIAWEARTPASFVGRIRYTETLEALPPG